MKRVLLPLALAAAITVPVGAQYGWFQLNGGLIARMSSAATAVTIQQSGSGALLDLTNGTSTYRETISGTSKLLQYSTGGAFSTVGTFTSGGAFTAVGNSTANNFLTQIDGGGFYVGARGSIRAGDDGDWYFYNNTGSNVARITLADWGTTTSCEAVSVAVDGTLNLGAAPLGQLFITASEDNLMGTYGLRGAGNAVYELQDPTGGLSATKDNANTINIYYDTNAYFIQNKRAGTRTIRACFIGA